jgi:hypothetical protein
MTPGARYAREQAEINVMKSQLNQLGRAWEQGLND